VEIPLVNFYEQDGVCIVDDEMLVAVDGTKTTNMQDGDSDRVNLVELLMWSINQQISNYHFGCVIHQHTDGRLQFAFGQIGNNPRGTINSVTWSMNKSLARLFGMR